MRIGIDLQSVSDIITNSSSEVFTVKAEMPISELKRLITEIADKNYFKGSWEEWEKLPDEEMNKYDSSSGMGGNWKYKRLTIYILVTSSMKFQRIKESSLPKKYTLLCLKSQLKNWKSVSGLILTRLEEVQFNG